MSAQSDLIGWDLEHVAAQGRRTRGRCVGAWPNGGQLMLALLQDDGSVIIIEHWRETTLRIAGGRKVLAA